MENDASHTPCILAEAYPICRSRMDDAEWSSLSGDFALSREDSRSPGTGYTNAFPEFLAEQAPLRELAAFLPDLACAERARDDVATDPCEIPSDVEQMTLNPTLLGLELGWKLAAHLSPEEAWTRDPEPGSELLLIWRVPGAASTRVATAREGELLAMKMALEGISAGQAAKLGEVALGSVYALLDVAAAEGIVILPRPRMRRAGKPFSSLSEVPERLLSGRAFCLQWHLTNACELHCKHCYDRSQPSPLTLDSARKVVADLAAFCDSRRIRGKATLTGGNPFLFRGFMDLYRAISETELDVSILGNPISRRQLRELVEIRRPSHFQVSLEGLEESNDAIRGPGHFRRVMDFLPMLREAGIQSGVMLTLGRANLDQALPLGEHLRGKVDRFNFNRLCQTGEGSDLEIPSREEYAEFLQRYAAAGRANPTLCFKDNLFNILQHESGQPLRGGCTSHGCGAAFDFVALLPGGEVHACRKFPSPIGNVLESGLEAVYESEAAERYRRGCRSCDSCPIRAACGGCLAVTAGQGRDPFEERDPHCFFADEAS